MTYNSIPRSGTYRYVATSRNSNDFLDKMTKDFERRLGRSVTVDAWEVLWGVVIERLFLGLVVGVWSWQTKVLFVVMKHSVLQR